MRCPTVHDARWHRVYRPAPQADCRQKSDLQLRGSCASRCAEIEDHGVQVVQPDGALRMAPVSASSISSPGLPRLQVSCIQVAMAGLLSWCGSVACCLLNQPHGLQQAQWPAAGAICLPALQLGQLSQLSKMLISSA